MGPAWARGPQRLRVALAGTTHVGRVMLTNGTSSMASTSMRQVRRRYCHRRAPSAASRAGTTR